MLPGWRAAVNTARGDTGRASLPRIAARYSGLRVHFASNHPAASPDILGRSAFRAGSSPMTTPDSKDPAAPAQPDSSRVPHVAYPTVLVGQPALVTGANSGIGKAVALSLARAGADVVVNYVTDAQAAEDVAHEIESYGRRALAIQADVSKEDQVERMFATAIGHFKTLHVLVSNAGLQRDAPF
jgi:hypothetical protein